MSTFRSNGEVGAARQQASVCCCVLSALLSLAACGGASPAHATPPAPRLSPSSGAAPKPQKSELLEESGLVKRGGQMAFFAGWALSAGGQTRPLNLNTLLKSGKRRYVLTICASWCLPCRDGLARISEARERFEQESVGVVVLVADTNKHARELIGEFKLGWTHMIVDEFNTNAVKLSPNPTNPKSLNLPRTFVFNASGEVELIIAQEGRDFVDLLIGDKR